MMHILARTWRIRLNLTRKNCFHFGGMPSSFLRAHQASNTEIVSLSSEETEQLLSINSYSQSVQQLRKNNLRESLVYLQNSLVQTKQKFPWSINLQVCLLSRVSILLKLLNQNRRFQDTLEEIYLLTLSARGYRHLDTIKSLINYAIALLIHRPQKCGLLLDYLKSQGKLPDFMLFFDAYNDIHTKKIFKDGITKMESLPEESSDEKIFKFNNIGFMKVLSLREQFKNPVQYLSELKNKSEQILKCYLTALLQAQSNPLNTSNYSQQQIKQSEKFIDLISGYLSNSRPNLSSQEVGSKNILKHNNSHIISMNIASLLFQLERLKESFYMLQLSLEKAMNLQELERVGMGLILLGRCYFLQDSDKWQDVYLDLLDHSRTYPKLIIKQALSSYSRLLFQRGRLFEAENYLNQSLSIEADSSLQGLILPSYDFSF